MKGLPPVSFRRFLTGNDGQPVLTAFPRGLDRDQRLIAQPAPERKSRSFGTFLILFLFLTLANKLQQLYGYSTYWFLAALFCSACFCLSRERTFPKI